MASEETTLEILDPDNELSRVDLAEIAVQAGEVACLAELYDCLQEIQAKGGTLSMAIDLVRGTLDAFAETEDGDDGDDDGDDWLALHGSAGAVH